MSNSGGSFFGTLLSGILYYYGGLYACLWVSAKLQVLTWLASTQLQAAQGSTISIPISVFLLIYYAHYNSHSVTTTGNTVIVSKTFRIETDLTVFATMVTGNDGANIIPSILDCKKIRYLP
jgi:lipopolysaccharide export system protein LptA